MKNLIKRILKARAEVVALVTSLIALGIGFDYINWTEDQIAIVLAVIVALFGATAKIGFEKSIEDLQGTEVISPVNTEV